MIGKHKVRWNWRTYDVWGNAEDGWEVNDVHPRGHVVLSPEPTLSEVLAALRKAGYLNRKATTRTVEEDSSSDATDIYLVSKADGYPLGCLTIEGAA